ncbi:MAG: decaprenyl-phosphate phosphoribosyltransferase, partial [bacterium]
SLIISMRPKQWIKNLFVFAALVFGERLNDPASLLKVSLGFVLFCLIAGSGYLINDIIDQKKDALHPLKSKRPIVSSVLKKRECIIFAFLFIIASISSSFFINYNFSLCLVSYLLLSLLYSFFLKNIVIIDILSLSSGFVIRVIAGAFATGVSISLWLLICTMLIALFLILSKRRHELVLLESDASLHREILSEYSPSFIDEMISAITGAAIIAYSLYAFQVRDKFGEYFPLTIPFVLYGIFRYLYLVHQKGRGGSPEIDITQDKPLMINLFLWIISVLLIIYGRRYL